LPARAISWAIDKVKTAEALAPLLRRLLSGVALFENLDDAIAARQAGLAAVTRSGEFISRNGILFAGSGRMRGDSLLERKTRINALAKELAVLKKELGALEKQRTAKQSQMNATASVLEEARRRHQEAHLAQTVAVTKMNELEREHETAERDLEIMRSEQTTLERQIVAADERLTDLDKQRADLENQVATGKNELARLEAGRDEALRVEEESAAKLAEARVTSATHEQKHEALLAQRAPMLARQAELLELMATRRADIENYEARRVTQAAETEAARQSIARQGEERTRRGEEIEKLASARATQVEAINARDSELREARNRLSELQEKRGGYSVRQTQLQLQIEHLLEHVTQRYQIDLHQFAPDVYAHEKVLRAQTKRSEKLEGGAPATPSAGSQELAPPEIEKLIADMTRQLDNMGPVNLDAVQEYDELEERYRFLETQNNDLTNSRRELLDVIARINSTTQKLFAETFAQVRVNFREMFAELFGGGRADLQLLDENDTLNCGIEIIAKPPGKQLQSVSLLSGGERTMTAVALLFAIYMVRPSPFCLLDEMDAPLDESNINRFIRVLERFVSQSQFIIITHNKRTIAKADVLYGVTMEERGVSKLVGMKMTPPPRAEERRDERANGNGSSRQTQFEVEESRARTLAATR
jgi:chromosome segregation protein